MSCPHLKEVVMLFCQAYPVKKMVPLDRLASTDPCVGGNFQQCAMFVELSARLRASAGEQPAASRFTTSPVKGEVVAPGPTRPSTE